MNETFGGDPFSSTQAVGSHSEKKADGTWPVLIKQVLAMDDGLQLYGMPFGMVHLVALVRNIDTSSTKITYTLEDQTGQIEAHFWLEESDTLSSPDVMLNCYARVIGSLRVQAGIQSIMILSMVPVKFANEITTHGLEILNAFYLAENFYKKKTGDNYGFEVTSGGFTSQNNPPGNSENPGLDKKYLVVYQAIKAHISDVGISMEQLLKKFSHLTLSELTKITDFLSQEGHIFSTIDAEHFMITDN